MDVAPSPLGGRPGTDEPSAWRLAAWWLASVVAAVAHNGLWATPNLAFVALITDRFGTNPFAPPLSGDYLLTDVSLTGLGHLLGQSEAHEVARLHLVVLLLGWAAVVTLARRRFGHRVARTLTVVIAMSPLVTVSMQWLGQPDPLTGMCGVAMVLVRRRWALAPLAVLAGLTHPEQALFMVLAAAVVRTVLPPADLAIVSPNVIATSPTAISTRGRWRNGAIDAAISVAAVAAARGGMEIWFRLSDITLRTPRTAFLDYGIASFLEHHTQQPLGLLWTLWGPLWLGMAALAVGMLVMRRRDRDPPGVASAEPGSRTAWIAMAVVAVAALVPMAATLDETRVYAVITAPLLAGLALWATKAVDPQPLVAALVGLLLVGALLPGGFATGVTSWRGQLDTAAMVTFLVDAEVPEEFDDELTTWLLSPFEFVIPDPPS